MSNLALDLLFTRLKELQYEREKFLRKKDEEIAQLIAAIRAINGGFHVELSESYDDESPTYITGTEDGI